LHSYSKSNSYLYGLDNNFHCRRSRRFSKLWLEDSDGNIYDTNMKLLEKDVVDKKDKEFKSRVAKTVS